MRRQTTDQGFRDAIERELDRVTDSMADMLRRLSVLEAEMRAVQDRSLESAEKVAALEQWAQRPGRDIVRKACGPEG